ncbi:MAG: outer membrane lipoprotein LolB [Bdellovibrio sp.]|nr:outer membrane lipoprotein LolB [Methylotenera sp.]
MRFYRYQLALFLTVLLAACASQPTAPSSAPPTATNAIINQQHLATLATIKSFALKGRMGVVTQKQGFSGSIDWQHQLSTDNIDVYSPVGGKVANIAKATNGVTLTDQKGRSISAQDAESLTEMTLGFRLPLTGLADWALGKPTASKIDASTWDEKGRLSTLKQDGWEIVYDDYTSTNGVDLPNKIVLKSEKVNLKLLVEKWQNTSN